MDTVKDRACVSRALVYNYFESVDDLIAALYLREVDELDRRIVAAVQTELDAEAKARAALRTYFDFEEERGDVFGQLQLRLMSRWFAPGARDRLSEMFAHWAAALHGELGLSSPIADTLARALLAATEMLVAAWRHKLMSRSEAEALALELSLASLRAVALRVSS